MRGLGALAGLVLWLSGSALAVGAPVHTSQSLLAKLTTAWNSVTSYQCTIIGHEEEGSAVQDRVYRYYFEKPFDTRADIVAGDGRGSVGVWRGGDSVRGHRGGFLRAIKLNVNLHSRLATTLRGTTFAQTNIGAILAHIRSLPLQSMRVSADQRGAVLNVALSDPKLYGGVTKELYHFGPNYLPVDYEQFEGSRLVVRVAYSDMQLHVSFPKSLFDV